MRIITPTFCRAVLPGPDGWGVPACGPGPGRRAGRGRPRCHGSTRWCAGGHVLRGARCGVLGAGRQLSAALSLRRRWSVARRQARVCARDAWAGGSYVSRGWLCAGGGLPSCSAGRGRLCAWGGCTGRIPRPQAGVARRPGPSDQCGAQSQTQTGAMPKLRPASRAGPGLRPAQTQAQTSAMRRIMSPTSVAVTPIIPIMPAVVRRQRRSRL